MGNANAKTASAPRAPESEAAFQLFRPKQKYRLEFTTSMTRTKEGRKLRSTHVQAAKEQLRDIGTWAPYLESTMRDAILQELQNQYPEINFEGRVPDVPCSDIRVHLSRRWPAEAMGVYHGYVEWTTAKCELEPLAESIAWRIGERMSMYEVADEDAGWHAFIHPGDLLERA